MPSHNMPLEVNFALLLFKGSCDPCTLCVCFEMIWLAMIHPFIKIVSKGLAYKNIVLRILVEKNLSLPCLLRINKVKNSSKL